MLLSLTVVPSLGWPPGQPPLMCWPHCIVVFSWPVLLPLRTLRTSTLYSTWLCPWQQFPFLSHTAILRGPSSSNSPTQWSISGAFTPSGLFSTLFLPPPLEKEGSDVGYVSGGWRGGAEIVKSGMAQELQELSDKWAGRAYGERIRDACPWAKQGKESKGKIGEQDRKAKETNDLVWRNSILWTEYQGFFLNIVCLIRSWSPKTH